MDKRLRIWVPEKEEPKESEMAVNVDAPTLQLSGHYTFELIDAKSQEVVQKLEFSNMITNAALDAIGFGTIRIADMFNYVEVGSGTTPPTGSDVALNSPLTPRTADNAGIGIVFGLQSSTVPYYHWARRTRLFYEAEANGVISEVGFWNASIGGTLCNRTLLRDNMNTPIFIVKNSTQQLKITYEWRMYPPTNTVTGSIVLKSNTYAYTIKPCNIFISGGAWSYYARDFDPGGGYLMALGQGWTGGSDVMLTLNGTGSFVDIYTASIDATTFQPVSFQNSTTSPNYITGSYYRDMIFQYDPGTSAFPNGIYMAYFSAALSIIDSQPAFQIKFTPPIVKTEDQRLKLVIRQAWNRSGSL